MKAFSVFAAILVSSAAFAQGEWVTMSSGTASDLNAIAFGSASDAIAVGSDGLALRTQDGGLSWNRIPVMQDVDLWAVSYISPSLVVAVGEKHWGTAALLVSYDSGSTWWVPNVSQFEPMTSLYFVSTARGYATSHGSILQTDDGGLTWSGMNIAGMDYLTSVHFTDANHGVVTGGTHDRTGFTMRTADGGRTWTKDADLYIEPLKSICQMDGGRAWRVGGDPEYGAFLSSTVDEGASWSQMVIPDVKLSLNDILFTDAQHGIAVGGVYELQTVDGGAHWTQSTMLENGYTNALVQSPRGELWAVGSNGRIMKRVSSPSSVAGGIAVRSVALLPNYPNPVSSSTELRFTLAERAHATLAVYAVDGSLVATVVDGMLDGGDHAATWNAVDSRGATLPTGTYLLKLTAGERSVTRRLNIVR